MANNHQIVVIQYDAGPELVCTTCDDEVVHSMGTRATTLSELQEAAERHISKFQPRTGAEQFFYEQLTWGYDMLGNAPRDNIITFNIIYAMERIDLVRLKELSLLVFPSDGWTATWPDDHDKESPQPGPDSIFRNIVSFKKVNRRDPSPTL